MNKQQVTFFSKNKITCPSCHTIFQREELQTGRGRINAGELTDELRRLYIPTQKYGVVNPLLYPILVCPKCLFAGLLSDFQKLPAANIKSIASEVENRHTLISKTFGITIDFTERRSLITGLAAYILAFASTIHLPKTFSPTARRGLYTLRAAWLAGDSYYQSKITHFKDLQKEMYHQAYLNYDLALDRQIQAEEPFDGFVWMGPDVDTNFGYDGMLYITALLNLKHLSLLPVDEQLIKLGQTKRVLSKIFGVGKATKEKPTVLVSNAKNLYIMSSDILSHLETQGADISIADTIEHKDDDSE